MLKTDNIGNATNYPVREMNDSTVDTLVRVCRNNGGGM
jgi:hypothetical protein